MTMRSALREWWLQVARLGMSPAEMIDSIVAHLDAAGYEIVRKKRNPVRAAEEHRLNYGRLWPDTLFKADCTCGWSCGPREKKSVIAAVREHENQFLSADV